MWWAGAGGKGGGGEGRGGVRGGKGRCEGKAGEWWDAAGLVIVCYLEEDMTLLYTCRGSERERERERERPDTVKGNCMYHEFSLN